jgi:hypothetical protein
MKMIIVMLMYEGYVYADVGCEDYDAHDANDKC